MRVLVTGARGLLGATVCKRIAVDHEVVGFDLPELDIADAAAVAAAFEERRPDAVINCAAYTDVDGAESEPELALRVNRDGARVIADESRRHGAYVIHISTDYVFDGGQSRPYEPGDPPAPLSAYGRSKLEGEGAVRSAHPEALIVRTCGLYGLAGRSFVKSILTRAAEGRPLRIVNDQTVGAPTYVEHMSRGLAVLLALRPSGIIHLVNQGVCTWYDFGCEALRAAGFGGVEVTPVPTSEFPRPAPRPAYSALASGGAFSANILLPHYREALAVFTPRWLTSSAHVPSPPGRGLG